MNNSTTVASLLAAVMIGGCAFPAGTIGEFHETAAHRSSLNVQDSYQLAYRKLVAKMRDCYTSGQIRVDGDLYSEPRRHGEITVYFAGDFVGRRYYAIVEVLPLGLEESRISVIASGAWDRLSVLIPRWYAGESADCE